MEIAPPNLPCTLTPQAMRDSKTKSPSPASQGAPSEVKEVRVRRSQLPFFLPFFLAFSFAFSFACSASSFAAASIASLSFTSRSL